MTVDFLRAVDRFAGTPLCYLALALRRVLRRAPHDAVRRILVIKFFGMGSILLATPALRALRARWPEARIDLLTFESQRGLGERLPTIDTVITVDAGSFLALVRTTGAIFARVRRAAYDMVIDFEFFSKISTLLGAWSGAPVHAGFALPTRWRATLLTHSAPVAKDRHVRESFLGIVEAVGATSVGIALDAPRLTDDDRAHVAPLLPQTGRLVAVHVGAGDTFAERRWMPERFAATVRALASRERTFVFTGVPSECVLVARVIGSIGGDARCIDVCGRLTIPGLAALFERIDLLITNDTGPAHLAAALGRPVLALYGPEDPRFYGPVSPLARIVYKRVACSPCMNVYDAKGFACPYEARCMREINAGEVIRIAADMLAR